ncbi:HDOD domain-containing protein [Parvibium lacunae]|nr:HDOD domain-containing protein [Parvibium lacunae]
MSAPYEIQRILTQSEELAPVSPAAIQLLQMLNDPDADLRQIADKVRLDPVVSLRVLRAANSAHFSRGRQVSAISEALMILGLTQARPLISAAIMLSNTRAPKLPGFDANQFWHHSIWAAANAEYLSTAVREAPWIGFTCGLLHDLGRLLFANAWPQEYARVLTNVTSDDAALCVAEKEVFGFDHTELGAALLEQWHLPADVCQAIRLHHQPANTTGLPLVGLLQFADEMANHIDGQHLQMVPAEMMQAHQIPLSEEQLQAALPAMEKHHERYMVLF